jgi:predicted metal-binding protein
MDWKGTLAAGKSFNRMTQQIKEELIPKLDKAMVLGSGPCLYCDVCGCKENLPCRHPDKAIRSLEANCVDVFALAQECGMKYINGPNTVTFFGSLLYNDKS